MRRPMIRLACLALLGLGITARPAAPQTAPLLSAGATFAAVRNDANDVGGERVSNGTLLGAQVAFRASLFTLRGEYLEGTMRQDGVGPDVEVVEGGAELLAQVHPWIALGVGVRAHRDDDTQPERWLAWALGARFEVPIIGTALRAHAAYRQGIGGTVNFPDAGVDSRSGEVGLTLAFARSPIWIGVASRVEEEEGAGRIRTRQRLGVTIGFSR